MKKIEQFQITSLMLSGFKSYEEPTELVFGNPTVITGGNGRGKSSIADAIAFAVTGCPFFGERGIDRLHNENKSSSQSPAVMERWVLKVQALEEKKRHYEGVLQRELDGLDDEFSVLKLLSQELQVRANGIRNLRFQQRAA